MNWLKKKGPPVTQEYNVVVTRTVTATESFVVRAPSQAKAKDAGLALFQKAEECDPLEDERLVSRAGQRLETGNMHVTVWP